jgi:hypothetical protein
MIKYCTRFLLFFSILPNNDNTLGFDTNRIVKSKRSLCQVFNAILTSSYRIENHTASQWLPPFACFGLTHAPERTQGLVRKNSIIGKSCGKAATAHNERFGKSGHYLVG